MSPVFGPKAASPKTFARLGTYAKSLKQHRQKMVNPADCRALLAQALTLAPNRPFMAAWCGLS
ncbi:MAG: hypothetical protein ACRC1J_00675, partial [Sandaracinobacteroides sp.]